MYQCEDSTIIRIKLTIPYPTVAQSSVTAARCGFFFLSAG